MTTESITINTSKIIRCVLAICGGDKTIDQIVESTGLPKETVEQELAKFDPYNLS